MTTSLRRNTHARVCGALLGAHAALTIGPAAAAREMQAPSAQSPRREPRRCTPIPPTTPSCL
jgi:hypothetical protein